MDLNALAKIFDYEIKEEIIPKIPNDLSQILLSDFKLGYIVVHS